MCDSVNIAGKNMKMMEKLLSLPCELFRPASTEIMFCDHSQIS